MRLRAAQQVLADLASGRSVAVAIKDRDAELDGFLNSLSTAWHDGEVRPTHNQTPAPRRYWRTRKDPLEAVWPVILSWLEAKPEKTAKELFARLQTEYAGAFPDGQLRTLQRRVKAWRSEMARQLIFATTDFGAIDHGGAAAMLCVE